MAKVQKIGPYGPDQGSAFDIDTEQNRPKSLVAVSFWSTSDRVCGIEFTYKTSGNEEIKEGPFGNKQGGYTEIKIEDSGDITNLQGTYDSNYITWLKITTNESTFDFGHQKGKRFQMDGKVLGFFGRAGSYVNALGAYMMI